MSEVAHETLAPERLLKVVGNAEGFAALYGAPADLVSLALAGMPRGTRMTALEYGLVEQEKAERLALTELGRELVAQAAALYPEPFAEVTVADVIESMHEALAAMDVDPELRLAEPQQVRQSLPHATTESAAMQLMQMALQFVRRDHGRHGDDEPSQSPGKTIHP